MPHPVRLGKVEDFPYLFFYSHEFPPSSSSDSKVLHIIKIIKYFAIIYLKYCIDHANDDSINFMNGYEQRKQQSKGKIIAAALELFAKNGIRKVSITEIAEKSGVNPVTIYNRFGTKKDLVRSSIEELIKTHWNAIRQILESDQPFTVKVKRIVSAKLGALIAYNSELLQSAIAFDRDIMAMVESYFKNEANPLIEKLISDGQQEGTVRKDVSKETLRLYITVLMEFARTNPHLFSGEDRASQTTKEIWSLFLHGIIARDSGDRGPSSRR